MQFAHIVPISNLHLIDNQPYNMFLTHLVEKYPEYEKYARNHSGYKILDNSLIELGDAVNLRRVLDAAIKISADEIILPDVFLNRIGTIQAVEEALEELYKTGLQNTFKVMAVVQGKNEDEWFRCYEWLNNMKEIDVLGIPKVTHKLHEIGRPYFVDNIANTVKDRVHLLGVWCDLSELERINMVGIVRGVDSSLPALYAKLEKPLTYVRKDDEIINLEMDYIDNLRLRKYMKEVDNYVSDLRGLQEDI